jgi:gas vesicle protein
MHKIQKFMFGAILGGAAGVIAVMLLTPSSGGQIRNSVTDYVNNLAKQITQAAADRRAELEKELAELRAPQNSKL